MRRLVEELDELSNKLLEMCSFVESAVQRSISAVTEKDLEAAEEVLGKEARINQIEIEIDDFAISLLALHQPMAADLRLIVAALKINTDLERMGDLAESIAHRAKSLMQAPMIKPMVDIPHIAGLVQSMVRKSLDAFVQRDAELARSACSSAPLCSRPCCTTRSHKLAWLAGVVSACLLLQSAHYLALCQVCSTVLRDAVALEGLVRKGILRILPIPESANR